MQFQGCPARFSSLFFFKSGPCRLAWLGTLLACALGVTSARGATGTWNTGSGAWNKTTNWSAGTIPGGSGGGDSAVLGSATSTTGTITLDDGAGHAYNPLLNSLTINPVGGSNAGFTINAGAGGHLTMTAGASINWNLGPGTGQANAINAGIVMQGALGINVLANSGTPLTIGGVISDGGGGFGVTVTGPGALTLTGANTYTGTTTVNSGTLNLNTSGGNALSGNLTVAGGTVVLQQSNQLADGKSVAVSAGSLNIGANSDTVAGLQVTGGTVTGTTGVLTSTSTFDVQAGSISAKLGGTVGLTKTGAGTATLSASNTYTGVTTISGGTLNLNTSGGNSVAGSVVVNGGTLVLQQSNQIADGKTVAVSSGSFSLGSNSETVAGVQLTGGSITGSGGVLTSTASYDMQSGSVSAVLGGAVGLNKTASGTVTLTGANTYTGLTTVTAGTLNLNTTGAPAVAGNVQVSGGVLTLQQSNQIASSKILTVSSGLLSIGANSNTVAIVQLNGGSITGTTGVLTSTATFNMQAGSVSAILGGTVGLAKTGTGTVTLSGVNTYTGTTAVTAGTLNLNTPGGAAVAGNVVVNGGTLVLQQNNQIASTGTVAISSGVINLGTKTQTVAGLQLTGGSIVSTTGVLTSTTNLDFQNGTVSAILGGTVGLNKTTTGTVTLSGANTFTGTTTVSAGTLNLNSTTGATVPGNLVVSGGTAALLHDNQIANTGSVAVTGGTLSMATSNNSVAGVQVAGGSITGTSGVLTSASTIDAQSGTVSAKLGGSKGLTKTTTGTVTLQGANTYTGTTTVSAGILNLNTTGGIAVNGGVVINGGWLVLQQSNEILSTQSLSMSSGTLDLGSHNQTLGGVKMTGGSITGTGKLTSTSNYDLQGGTVNAVLAGTVGAAVTNGATTFANQNIYTGTTTVSANGTLNLNSSTGRAVAGALTVSSTGTAALLANNQLSGNVQVQITGGTLNMGAFNAIAGGVQLTGGGQINGTGALSSNTDFDLQNGTVNAVLAGSTGATISSGTVTLNGTNTYTGLTIVNSGTLKLQGSTGLSSTMEIGGTGTLSGGGTVVGTATLSGNGVINLDASGVIQRALAVSGGSWTGLGTVEGAVTSGSNTFTLGANAVLTALRGLDVTGGTLTGSGTLVGNVTLSGSGIIDFAPGGSITGSLTVLSGTLNGTATAGSLTLKSGDAFSLGSGAKLTLTSGQILSPNASAVLNGGEIIAPGTFRINTNGTLLISSDLTSATGGLIKSGTGTLRYAGNAVLGGTTEIQAGTFTLDGTLTTPLLQLDAGSVFNGSGQLNGSVSNLGGVFNPGHSPGTLFVNGNYSQNAASTLVLEVLNSSVHDRVIATGAVNIAGTLAVHNYGGHRFDYGDMVTGFVQGARIEGTFDKVTMPQSNLRGRVLNTGTSLTLLAAPASYTLLAGNANQRQEARALDRWIGRETGDVGTVTLALDVLRAPQYRAAFEAISPAYYSVLPHVRVEEISSQNSMLQQRFSQIRAEGRATQAERAAPAQAADPSAAPAAHGGDKEEPPASFAADVDFWRPWIQMSGQFSQMDTLQTLASNHFDSFAAMVGMDRRLGEESAAGVAVGYGNTHLGFNGGQGTTIDAGRVTLYGVAGLGDGWFLEGSVGGGYANYDVKRPVIFSFIDRLARGQTDGEEVDAAVEFGKDIHLGNWTVTPQMGFQFARAHMNGFTESGAGALNLGVKGFSDQSMRGTLGAQVAYHAKLSDKVTLAPYLFASWQHEFDSHEEEVRAALPADGGSFTYNGGSLNKDRMLAGAGLMLSIGPDLAFTLGYQAEFGSGDYESHLIMLMVSYRF